MQSKILNRFRERLRRIGYLQVSIKRKSDFAISHLYCVTCVEPLFGREMSGFLSELEMKKKFKKNYTKKKKCDVSQS